MENDLISMITELLASVTDPTLLDLIYKILIESAACR
jgi:hypothetical protein